MKTQIWSKMTGSWPSSLYVSGQVALCHLMHVCGTDQQVKSIYYNSWPVLYHHCNISTDQARQKRSTCTKYCHWAII